MIDSCFFFVQIEDVLPATGLSVAKSIPLNGCDSSNYWGGNEMDEVVELNLY